MKQFLSSIFLVPTQQSLVMYLSLLNLLAPKSLSTLTNGLTNLSVGTESNLSFPRKMYAKRTKELWTPWPGWTVSEQDWCTSTTPMELLTSPGSAFLDMLKLWPGTKRTRFHSSSITYPSLPKWQPLLRLAAICSNFYKAILPRPLEDFWFAYLVSKLQLIARYVEYNCQFSSFSTFKRNYF